MSSKVEICNMALSRIAAPRIESLDDGTGSANDCKAIFDLCLKHTTSIGPWPSARRRATLAQLSETPAFGYGYQYQLPADFIKLISVNGCKIGAITYEIEGNSILYDENTMAIRYIAMPSDVSRIDAYLEQAFIDRLVVELIYKKTGSPSTFQAALKQHLERAIGLLSEACVGSKSAEYIDSDTFVDARFGDGYNEGRLRDRG